MVPKEMIVFIGQTVFKNLVVRQIFGCPHSVVLAVIWGTRLISSFSTVARKKDGSTFADILLFRPSAGVQD
jgi:hypothetical protein